MAGKVAQFEKAINPDAMARNLAELYNQWWIQRQNKETEWRELRNYLFATDTTTTTNSTLPWKNKTTLPKLTQIRDNLHANEREEGFPNDDWMKWEGATLDDSIITKRKAIEAYLKTKIKESGFRETVAQLVADYIDYGNCFADVTYVHEAHIDPVTGESITTYNGPKLVRISPYDIVFNPTATTFEDTFKIIRSHVSLGDIMKLARDNPEEERWVEAVVRRQNIKKNSPKFTADDWAKQTQYLVGVFGNLAEYYNSDTVEVLEFYGD